MSLFNSPNPPKTTSSGASPAGTVKNGDATITPQKMFSIGETQTDTPRAKSGSRFNRHPNRYSASTCGSALGNSAGPPKGQTPSPGFSFGTGQSFEPKSTPTLTPPGLVLFGPSKPSSFGDLPSIAATSGSITGGNTPACPGFFAGQNGPTAPGPPNASSLGAVGSKPISAASFAEFKMHLESKLNVPVNPTATTSTAAPGSSSTTTTSTQTGSTPLSGPLSSAISSGAESSKPASTSVFTGSIFGTPASGACTGFNFTCLTPTPASTTTVPFPGFNSGTPVSSASTGFNSGTPVSSTSTGSIFGTPVSSASSGQIFGAPASNASTGGIFGAPVSNPSTGSIFATPVSNPSTGSIFATPVSNPSTGSMFLTPVSSPSTGPTLGLLKLSCKGISATPVSSTATEQISSIPASKASTGSIFGTPASSTSSGFTGFSFPTTPAPATSAANSEHTERIFGTPASLSFSFRAAAPQTTSSNKLAFVEVTPSTPFNFGRTPFMVTGALPLRNTTAPTNIAGVTNTSGSQASLGSATTVTNSSSGDRHNNVRISCSENNSDDDKNKMKEDPQFPKFTTTFESFFPLVDDDYWIRARREPQFQENTSLSMYRYYMAQHLYARLVQIRAAKGMATRDEQKFANHVQSVAPSVPNGIFTYLKKIGDIQVPLSQDFFEYSFLTWPNNKGHFGKLNNENHWMYMSFPAPAIVTQAIQEDLDMDDLNPQSIWDLRDDLKPLYSYAVSAKPNANLLGWKPATVLTIPQRQKLQLCGIFQDSFDVINSQFQFNPKIMSIVHDYLQESPRAFVDVEKYYEKRPQNFGGVEQLAWLERDDEGGDVPFSKTFASVERNVRGIQHPLQRMDESVGKLSLIIGFRVDKSKGGNDWVVYDQGDYENVPRGWMETRNKVFEFGDVGGVGGNEINESWRRDAMRHEFLEKCYQGVYYN